MFDWISDIVRFFANAIYNFFEGIKNLLFDIPIWLFDQIMTLSEYAISQVFSLFAPMDLGQYISNIPPTAAWVMSMVGLPQCLSIIVGAICIRLILQLIPFTRLGS